MSKEFLKNKINLDTNNSFQVLAKKFAKFADLNQDHCFICKSKKAKKDCNIFGIDYVICENCSHVYVKKRLSEKIIRPYEFDFIFQ